MPLKITCTACGESWKPSKPVAPGKRVRCPECSEIFMVAADDARPAEPRSRRAAAEIEAPRRRQGTVAERSRNDDEEPRRRRPRDNDDYDDERPRKGKNKPAGKRGLLISLIAGGVHKKGRFAPNCLSWVRASTRYSWSARNHGSARRKWIAF